MLRAADRLERARAGADRDRRRGGRRTRRDRAADAVDEPADAVGAGPEHVRLSAVPRTGPLPRHSLPPPASGRCHGRRICHTEEATSSLLAALPRDTWSAIGTPDGRRASRRTSATWSSDPPACSSIEHEGLVGHGRGARRRAAARRPRPRHGDRRRGRRRERGAVVPMPRRSAVLCFVRPSRSPSATAVCSCLRARALARPRRRTPAASDCVVLPSTGRPCELGLDRLAAPAPGSCARRGRRASRTTRAGADEAASPALLPLLALVRARTAAVRRTRLPAPSMAPHATVSAVTSTVGWLQQDRAHRPDAIAIRRQILRAMTQSRRAAGQRSPRRPAGRCQPPAVAAVVRQYLEVGAELSNSAQYLARCPRPVISARAASSGFADERVDRLPDASVLEVEVLMEVGPEQVLEGGRLFIVIGARSLGPREAGQDAEAVRHVRASRTRMTRTPDTSAHHAPGATACRPTVESR